MQRIRNNTNKARLVFVALMLVILTLCVVACDAERDFTLSCSLTDGCVVYEQTLEFAATAYYNDEPCDVGVSVNGNPLDIGDDGKYVATLDEGENTITIAAFGGNDKYERDYTVTYVKQEVTIYTDITDKRIVNDVLYFSASATCGELPCGITVLCGGNALDSKDGKYSVPLTKGENKFSFIARKGDAIVQRDEKIEYSGFRINTDLKSVTTDSAELSFRAIAVYGSDVCDLKASVDGKALESNGIKFEYVFTDDGEYVFELAACKDNMTYRKEYVVSYCDKEPYFELFTLENGKQFKGDRTTFDVVAKNGLGKKLEDSNVTFFADFDADDGVDNFEELKSSEIAKVWSDQVKASYRLNFEGGRYKDAFGKATVLRAHITYGNKTTDKDVRITYIGADADGCIGTTVLSIEGFTIDCGYILVPTEVKIYKGVNYAKYLCAEIEKNGWTYQNTGTLDKGFYLARICGLSLENNKINTELLKIMKENGFSIFAESIAPKDGKYTLGEFDYASGSGWMYSVNGSFPNYGFADYYPQDGDVVRVQFTLCLGADLGGSDAVGFGGSNYNTNNADYKAIHTLIADVAARDYYGKGSDALNETIRKIAVWNVKQSVLDDELAKIKEYYL